MINLFRLFDDVQVFSQLCFEWESLHVIWSIIWIGLIKATCNITGI